MSLHDPDGVSFPGLFREFFRTIRTVYAVPASVLVLLCLIVAWLPVTVRHTPPSPAVSRPIVPSAHRASLVLRHRSAPVSRKPGLVLSPDVKFVDVTLLLPHSADSTRYKLTLLLPSKETVGIPRVRAAVHHDEKDDAVGVSLQRDLLQMEGDYKVIAEGSPARQGARVHTYSFAVSLQKNPSASRKHLVPIQQND